MRLRVCAAAILGVALLLTADPASAQYTGRLLADPATGETYRVELGG